MNDHSTPPRAHPQTASVLERPRAWFLRNTPQLIALASLVALGVALTISWPLLRDYAWDITWWPLAVAALAYPPALLLAATLWGAILRHLGGQASWSQNLKVYCASCLARRLPTPVWFIAGRLSMYHAIGVAQRMTSVAMLLEATLIVFSGALVSLVAILLPGNLVSLPPRYTPWLAGLSLACLALVLQPRVLPRIMTAIARRLGRDAPWDSTVNHTRMFAWTGAYVLIWVLGGVTLFGLTRALYPLPVSRLPSIIGIWAVAGMISHLALFLPAGLGIRELSLVVMLSSFTPLPVAIVVAIVTRLWYSILEILVFGLTLRLRS